MNKYARSIGQRKRSNLQSMGTEEDKGIENIFNKIIKNFLNLGKEIDIQLQEIFNYSCTCVCARTHMCRCMCGSQNTTLGHWISSPIWFQGRISLVTDSTPHTRLIGPCSSGWASCLCLPSHHRSAGITETSYCICFVFFFLSKFQESKLRLWS